MIDKQDFDNLIDAYERRDWDDIKICIDELRLDYFAVDEENFIEELQEVNDDTEVCGNMCDAAITFSRCFPEIFKEMFNKWKDLFDVEDSNSVEYCAVRYFDPKSAIVERSRIWTKENPIERYILEYRQRLKK